MHKMSKEDKKMAFCTNCGAQVPDGTKFCTDCGTKIEQPAAAPVQEAPKQEAPQQETPKQEIPVEQPVRKPEEAAPVQGSYTPPTQQSYQAPQQSYTPPTQQSYQAPQQQYSAQPAYAPAAKAPKQKKPMDKKTLFIIGGAALVVILAIVLIAVFAGKGGNAPASTDPNLGVYNATTAEMWGVEMEVSDFWEKGFSIELKDKGKCAMEVDGAKSNGKWTLEDGAFHVKGGGVDCDGTLANGVMTLENVLGMGITLTFEKEGGSTVPAEDPNGGAVAGASDLQKQWNGTWYGAMYVSEATGDFSDVPSDFYDVYMVVDVDAEGKGTFAVYLDGVEEAFALANCEAKESGLYAVDGTIAGGMEMYAYNWMFLPMPDYPDQYTMGDELVDGDSSFNFTLFMKQWGGSWQKEIDSDFAIVPPSVDRYNAAIENGEIPPVGMAPIGYAGSAAPSGGSSAGSSGDPVSFTGPTETYNYFDEIFVTYPSDTFFQDENAILDTIAAKDGSVKISIITRFSEGDHAATMEAYDSYSSYDQYTTKDLTIAGYEARMITYVDMWGDYCAEVHVNFGEPISGNYCVDFSITSEKSMDACTSDIVMAIINTLTAS